ncbi:hypothetical protein [Micromonospora aurantiaca]|uniref:hypothetical protein n=1 Tax=Micromonospora aurantiaca (nom. illeg.) TaxID=47850 RepID=UPI0038053A63
MLNHATTGGGSDRSGLARFQRLPVAEVRAALATILDAHLAVSAAGYVAVDLYDGCFLYDFDAHRMRLIDLDEYRPGPFVLDSDRLPGSRRYLSPEELTRGATIDERTTVHALGRTLHHLLDARPAGGAPPPSARSPTGPAGPAGPIRRSGTPPWPRWFATGEPPDSPASSGRVPTTRTRPLRVTFRDIDPMSIANH